MNEFLELNLLLSLVSSDESGNDEDDYSLLTESPSGKLYVKAIENSTKNVGATEKTLQINDLIMELNDNQVSDFDQFKIGLFELNVSNQTKENPDPVRLLVKRKAVNVKENNQNSKSYQSFSLKDINYKNYTSFNGSISSTIIDKSNQIETFNSWFLSPKYTQFFFPLYIKQTKPIAEENLVFYSNFRNINTDKLKQLISIIESKIFETQDYLTEFKVWSQKMIAQISGLIMCYMCYISSTSN
jgi:hypothetical protein